jgi:hypothetical protein
MSVFLTACSPAVGSVHSSVLWGIKRPGREAYRLPLTHTKRDA